MLPAVKVTNLHSFGDGSVPNDGTQPSIGIIQAKDGDLYGVTYAGGSTGYGVVYKITTAGVLTVLKSWAESDNGMGVLDPLFQSADGTLYGTTTYGGSANRGSIFKITSTGDVTVLHSFGDGSVAHDASRPFYPPTAGPDGNLYGLTTQGGAYGYGAFYKVTPAGAVTVLYSFDAPTNSYPEAPLVLAGDGNFYSSTGNFAEDPFYRTDRGSLFRVSPTGVFKTLYVFPETGTGPMSPFSLTQGVDGNLYGCSNDGGTAAKGTVYRLSYGTTSTHFLSVDTSTQGNWKDNYGADGYNVIGDASAGNPHYRDYVSVTAGAHNSGVWAASSLFSGALQSTPTGSVNRVAGVWSQTSMTLTVNTTGPEQLALYLLDYSNAGYAETITVRNAMTGAVLDSRNASSFRFGSYNVYTVSGYVTITLASTAGHWAVLSGIFFGGASGSKSPGWPANLTASTVSNGINLTWDASTGATSYNIYRGTSIYAESTKPIATVVKTTSYLDKTGAPNTTYYYEVVGVNAYAGGFASQDASATTNPAATATFVKTDTTTQGNWKGNYGIDGYNVIGDTSGLNPSYPSYATVTASTHTAGVWSASTSNVAALQKVATGSTDRIAGVWFNTTWSMNLNVAGTHQVALYFLDYPNAGYAETVTIKDAATGTVLDTRPISAFQRGTYEVWNVSGNITMTLTSTAGHWAPVSGIFFG